LRVDFGASNMRGLTTIQAIARPTPMRHQAPIQCRLEIASDRMESTLSLVQTLAGFACRI
jgi:hypothetical protein